MLHNLVKLPRSPITSAITSAIYGSEYTLIRLFSLFSNSFGKMIEMKKDQELLKYCFTRVIFGATHLQFLLNGVVKMHVDKYAEINQNFTTKILREFYMDDLNNGVN